MSWDATLTDDRGHVEGDWNYTHNTNRMVNHALFIFGDMSPFELIFDQADSWWRHLDGMTGPKGAEFLGQAIKAMRADPALYIEMNPANGWGDYTSLLGVLEDMHRSVPEWPTTWSVHG